MQRIPSSMTPKQLQAWKKRHAQSLTTGAEWLGLSRRQFADYLNGTYEIPRTVALLCAAYSRIQQLQAALKTHGEHTNA